MITGVRRIAERFVRPIITRKKALQKRRLALAAAIEDAEGAIAMPEEPQHGCHTLKPVADRGMLRTGGVESQLHGGEQTICLQQSLWRAAYMTAIGQDLSPDLT